MRKSHLILYVLLVIICVPIIGMSTNEIARGLGLRAIPVPVVGTGSMYPSLYWSKSEGGPEDDANTVIEEYRTTPHLYRRFHGITIFGHIFLRRSVGYGDMVAFKNDQTVSILDAEGKDSSSGFIKRVIGVPGDTIELRDGFVYRNGDILDEPYIAAARSSYGGTTISDCQKIKVEDGSYLVLGDNRKVSSDSRYELGLIHDADIQFVLPYKEQQIYEKLYRDTSKDDALLGQPTLSTTEFVELANKLRQSKQLAPFSQKQLLAKSASLRGSHLLKDPDSTYSLQDAIKSTGYSNIVIGEFVSRGHFTAQELLENLLYNAGTAKQLLDTEYIDIGVSAINQDVAGCPMQIIVGHLGGYVPASYEASTIASWQKLSDNLASTIPSWEQARGEKGVDQSKLETLLAIFKRRLSLAEELLSVMHKKAWLSDDQNARIKADQLDATRAEELSKELNNP